MLYGRLWSGNEVATLPGILRYVDLPDLLAALAPAPLQLQFGTADPYLDAAAAAAAETVAKARAVMEASEALDVQRLPISHGTDLPLAAQFFKAASWAVPPPLVPPTRVRFDVQEVHAAVGMAHLERLAAILAERTRLAEWYDAHLDAVPRLRRHEPPPGAAGNFYKYVVLLDDDVDRHRLKQRLQDRHGVTLAGEVYDMLLPDQPYYAARFGGREFPRARWFAERHVCLPVFSAMTVTQQRRVLAALECELS